MKINDIYQKKVKMNIDIYLRYFFMYKIFLIILAKIQLFYNVFLKKTNI